MWSAAGAGRSAEVCSSAVASSEVGSGGVASSELGSGDVASSEVGSGGVISSELGSGNVASSDVGSGVVGSDEADSGLAVSSLWSTAAGCSGEVGWVWDDRVRFRPLRLRRLSVGRGCCASLGLARVWCRPLRPCPSSVGRTELAVWLAPVWDDGCGFGR